MEAAEEQIRDIIFDTIRSEKILNKHDFEFLEANGKCICVPAQPTNFKWTERAIKQLSGAGAIYIRIKVERESSFSDFSSDSCPEPEVNIVKVESLGKLK